MSVLTSAALVAVLRLDLIVGLRVEPTEFAGDRSENDRATGSHAQRSVAWGELADG